MVFDLLLVRHVDHMGELLRRDDSGNTKREKSCLRSVNL